jgi:hypothetical protein
VILSCVVKKTPHHVPTIPGLVGRVGGNCAEGFSCRNKYLFRTTGHSFSPQSLFFMSFSCNRAGSHKKCCRPASSNIISMKTKTRSKHLNAHIHMTFFILKSAILNLVYTSSVCAFDVPFLRGSAGVSLSYLLSVASNFEAPIALTISDTTLLFL